MSRSCSECNKHGTCAKERKVSSVKGWCSKFYQSRRSIEANRDRLASDLQATRAELETARAEVERLRTREFTMEDFERINERVRDLVTALPHMANEVRIQTWIDSVNEWLRGGEA